MSERSHPERSQREQGGLDPGSGEWLDFATLVTGPTSEPPPAEPAGMIRYSTFLRPEQLARMRAIQAEVGIPVANQIRRAIDEWFKK